jgi:hypothetical protein
LRFAHIYQRANLPLASDGGFAQVGEDFLLLEGRFGPTIIPRAKELPFPKGESVSVHRAIYVQSLQSALTIFSAYLVPQKI